jgi:hypothetical protein
MTGEPWPHHMRDGLPEVAQLRMRSMKASAPSSPRTLASIRQLCCLNLSEELFVPKFLDALRSWIPFSSCHFFWADEKTQQPANYSGDGVADMEVLRHFFAHSALIDHPGVAQAFPDAMRTQLLGTFGGDRPETANYLRSDLYHEVMRPLEGRYVLYMVARDSNGHPKGMISLMRHGTGKPYTDSEHARLLQLEPYLRHALTSRGNPAGSASESRDAEGMAVLDHCGTLRYSDRQAAWLMWLASHEHINSHTLFHMDDCGITPQLKQLHRRLTSVFEGQDVAPPVFECRNRWGRFVFRGRWLQGSGERAVGVTVSHYIPRMLKSWQSLHGLGLAPRQQQVALLYSEGHTLAEISAELNISRHTVTDYVAVIHERLGIGPGREALQSALLP